ncbi:MAG: CoA transferase [Betaproteobacteria bacterium]|nr:CoA transferase [Betaproteobacteria bacterium]
MFVLELANGLAGPFACTLLADFGAEVVKVERPEVGDFMRQVDPSGGAWWSSMSRGKRSIAVDLANSASRDIIRDLVVKADVMIESFRPGVLERLGYGPELLLKWNPDLIVLRVSGYGQTGPYRNRPGFGKTAEAFAGLLHMTGFPDGPPVYTGFAIADMCSGLMGAYSVLLAWIAREKKMAGGQVIDLALYETILRLMDYLVPVATGSAISLERAGNRQPMGFAPSGISRTRDDRWVVYSAATAEVVRRVISVVAGQDYAQEPKFVDLISIRDHLDEIDELVAGWCARHTAEEVVKQFTDADAVAALVYSPSEIVSDPHVLARQSIVSVDGIEAKFVNVTPKLSKTPGAIRAPGPKCIGSDGLEILRDVLGYDKAKIAEAASSRAVTNLRGYSEKVESSGPACPN